MPLTDKQLYRVIDDVNSYYRITSESKKELLLNKYPNAAAAYSLRLLDGYYRDPLVRVRRDGDGAEVDVYADYNNEVSLDSLVTNVADIDDTTTDPDKDADATFLKGLQSLGEFVHDDAYDSVNPAVTATVCVWYDQANENDAKQAVADNQPTIYTGGALVLENGKPTLDFDSSDEFTTTEIINVTPLFFAAVAQAANRRQMFTIGSYLKFEASIWQESGLQLYQLFLGGVGLSGTILNDLNQHLFTGSYVSGAVSGHVDGTLDISGTSSYTGSDSISIGARNPNQMKLQEIVIYTSDESTNRQGIEQDINNHYQIDGYTPTPKLIDLTQALAVQNGGTTADGTPAAAYSLRLLSSTYTGPLVRIRRTIDNTEVDVYPDSDGEFSIYSTIKDGGTELTTGVTGGSTDKTTLHEFLYGQDTDCMIVRWYDQASGNHATQDVATSQPKIYDSVAGVVLENGKAAVLFSGAQYVDSSDITTTTATIFAVIDNGGSSSEFYGTPDYTQNSYYRDQGIQVEVKSKGNSVTSTTTARIDFKTVYYRNDSSTHEVAVNNQAAVSSAGTHTITNIKNRLGARTAFSYYFTGHLYEFVIYDSDQSSNRTGIETNINQHYNIY